MDLVVIVAPESESGFLVTVPSLVLLSVVEAVVVVFAPIDSVDLSFVIVVVVNSDVVVLRSPWLSPTVVVVEPVLTPELVLVVLVLAVVVSFLTPPIVEVNSKEVVEFSNDVVVKVSSFRVVLLGAEVVESFPPVGSVVELGLLVDKGSVGAWSSKPLG